MSVYNIECVLVFGNGESSNTKITHGLGHFFGDSFVFSVQENRGNSDFFGNSSSLKDCISELNGS